MSIAATAPNASASKPATGGPTQRSDCAQKSTLRLLPIAPFGLVSYAFGATGVSFRAYLAGTSIGMLPSTVIYASLGASALNPGTPGFALSLTAALVMALATSTGAAILTRRRLRRQPGTPLAAAPDPGDRR
jgi:hypothetical protein